MNSFVSIWGNAMSIVDHRPESYAKDMTLRYDIFIPFDTSHIRLSLDNFTGLEDVTFDNVTIGKSIQDFDVVDIKDVTFDRETVLTLHPGKMKQSDVIDMELKAGDHVLISIYFKDFTSLRCGVTTLGPDSKAMFALHDQSHASVLPHKLRKKTNWFYFLNQVDIEADASTIICYGDSITAQDWPEYLQHLIYEDQLPYGVIRRAVSGTRVLREYDDIIYDSYGLKGTHRFPHESLCASGKIMLIQQGINDIIHPVGTEVNEFRPWSDLPTADELIDGLRYYIQESRQLGYTVFMGTLLPIGGWRTYAPFRNELRNEINEWIRTTDEIDACVDFDKALCNPDNPAYFLDIYDSGDHLHPSKKGYQKMAETSYQTLQDYLKGKD